MTSINTKAGLIEYAVVEFAEYANGEPSGSTSDASAAAAVKVLDGDAVDTSSLGAAVFEESETYNPFSVTSNDEVSEPKEPASDPITGD